MSSGVYLSRPRLIWHYVSMGKVTNLFKGFRVKPISPEKAQALIDAGANPMHPAFSRVQRDNVVKVDFQKKDK